MSLTGFDLFVWAASFIGHLILLSVLIGKKRYNVFPAFTGLILFSLIRTPILYFLYSHHSASYFNTYWALAGIDAALGFAIVLQGASIVFRPTGAWAPDVRAALWLTIAVSVAIAGVLTYLAAPAAVAPVQIEIVKGKFLAATLMTELFVGMMTLSARVGLPWRPHVMHICTGLGIYAAFCVIVDTTISCYGIRAGSELYGNLSHARILFYLAVLTYWIVALLRNPPERGSLPPGLGRQLGALQQQLDADLVRVRALK